MAGQPLASPSFLESGFIAKIKVASRKENLKNFLKIKKGGSDD
jgi:hypothetical protein